MPFRCEMGHLLPQRLPRPRLGFDSTELLPGTFGASAVRPRAVVWVCLPLPATRSALPPSFVLCTRINVRGGQRNVLCGVPVGGYLRVEIQQRFTGFRRRPFQRASYGRTLWTPFAAAAVHRRDVPFMALLAAPPHALVAAALNIERGQIAVARRMPFPCYVWEQIREGLPGDGRLRSHAASLPEPADRSRSNRRASCGGQLLCV
jgi:hypothetical protein